MIVTIVSVAAVVLALAVLAVLVGGLQRRLKRLDAQLAVSRTQLAELNDTLGQVPGRSA